MKIITRADGGQWIKATNAYERIIAKAATQAMRDVGKEGVKKGREVITAAGFSQSFARTLRAINKPPTGYVLNPAVYIHSTINYADVFEKGATIHGDPYLWLPLPNVPPLKGRPHMTPKQYITLVGPLVTMRRPGKPPMLGAVVESGRARPTRTRLRHTFLRQRFGERTRQTTVVPMFIAVTSITIPKKFDVHSAIEDAAKQLDEFYAERFEPYEGRK